MSQSLFWLLVAAEKDDVVLINAESEMWGNMEFIDKVKLSVGKSVILQTRNKEKTYHVVKHGAQDFSKELEELKKELNVCHTVEELNTSSRFKCQSEINQQKPNPLAIKVNIFFLLLF